jgi:hypothetical protein
MHKTTLNCCTCREEQASVHDIHSPRRIIHNTEVTDHKKFQNFPI